MKERRFTIALAASISLLTLALFAPSVLNGFVVWDDDLYVYENLHIRSLGPSLFLWAFSLSNSAGFWHPLPWLSHALDYALYGLNPAGHHATNVILHALNTFIAVLLMSRLMHAAQRTAGPDGPERRMTQRTVMIAIAAAGLLFGIHPLRVESVAWISERKDLLYSLFYLLSIMAYTGYVSAGAGLSGKEGTAFLTNRRYILSLTAFILSLSSKPMAVTLPVILLLLDWYPFRRFYSAVTVRRGVYEKIPFLLCSLGVSVVTLLAQMRLGALAPLERVPISDRLLLALRAPAEYLGSILAPRDLMALYPIPKDLSMISAESLLSVGAAAGITVFCVVTARNHKRLWSVAWGYYVVSLFPVLGIFQSGLQAMADRFTYLPGLGPFLLLGLTAARCWERIGKLQKWKRPVQMIAVCLALALIAGLSAATLNQITVWRDSITLWTRVIARYPNQVPLAYNNRGVAFRAMGRQDRAIEDYTTAITLAPADAKYYANRGIAYGETDQFDKAMEDLNKAIELNTSYPDAYVSRGLVLARTGYVERALEDYDRAISLDPSNVDAYLNRGLAYEHLGDLNRALTDLDRVIALGPADPLAYGRRGAVFAGMGRISEAIEDQTRALSLKPDLGQAYYDRGNLYKKVGRRDRAREDLQKACDLGIAAGCDSAGDQGRQQDEVISPRQ